MRLLSCLILGMLAVQVQAAEPKTAEPNSPKPEAKSVSANLYSADLLQLYGESRLEDPRVLAAYARKQLGAEQEREAFGSLLPQVTASAGANRIKQVNEQVNQIYNSENYSIGLSQVLYNKASWENYKKYQSMAKQSASEADEAQAEATVDLAQRYFAALAADDELELVQAERRATQKTSTRSKRCISDNWR